HVQVPPVADGIAQCGLRRLAWFRPRQQQERRRKRCDLKTARMHRHLLPPLVRGAAGETAAPRMERASSVGLSAPKDNLAPFHEEVTMLSAAEVMRLL